jgi:hypothetical protein
VDVFGWVLRSATFRDPYARLDDHKQIFQVWYD